MDSSSNFGGFYPTSADDDICAGNFRVEAVWSRQMERIEADKPSTADEIFNRADFKPKLNSNLNNLM